jgi:hypothetical protein
MKHIIWYTLSLLMLATYCHAAEKELLLYQETRRTGITNQWFCPLQRLQNVSRWTPGKSEVPLSLSRAVDIACKWIAKKESLHVEPSELGAKITRIVLEPIHSDAPNLRHLFYYQIEFSFRAFDYCSSVVLLDGSVVEPKPTVAGSG